MCAAPWVHAPLWAVGVDASFGLLPLCVWHGPWPRSRCHKSGVSKTEAGHGDGGRTPSPCGSRLGLNSASACVRSVFVREYCCRVAHLPWMLSMHVQGCVLTGEDRDSAEDSLTDKAGDDEKGRTTRWLLDSLCRCVLACGEKLSDICSIITM